MNRSQPLLFLLTLALAALALPRMLAAAGPAGVGVYEIGIADASVASIGDYVWNDGDGDGRQDEGPDAGLDGVSVRLYQDDGDGVFEPDAGDEPMGAVTTANGGFYHFDLEAAGSYWVEVDPELVTTRGYLTHAGPQSRVSPHLVAVAEGSVENVDFGYIRRGDIGGVVFADADEDGEQGLGEAGLAEVELRLFSDANGNGAIDAEDVPLARTFSQPDGAYIFRYLLPADYVVVMTTPPGARPTTPLLYPVHLVTGEVAGASYPFGAYQAGSRRLFTPRLRG